MVPRMKWRPFSAALIALLPLAGCAEFPLFGREVPPQVMTPEALDSTTPEELAAAVTAAQATSEQILGSAVVALGSPVEPGFWLKTSLVAVATPGRVVAAGGASVGVELIPIEGGGATQLSLAAFRALGLSLTDLPEVTIYAN